MKLQIKYYILALSILLCWYLSTVSCTDSKRCLQEDAEGTSSSYDISPHLEHVSEFTFNFFRNLAPFYKGQNIVVSPYSIWNALALVYLGSAGDTEAQLKNVLKINGKEETLKRWRAVDYLYQMRQMQTNAYRFGLVNKAYFSKDFALRECIHQVLQEELQLIDFNKKDESAHTINAFVSKNTNEHIKSIVNAADLEGVKMTLVNAAFFSDQWKNKFEKSKTERQRFYPFSGQEEYVEMMRIKADFNQGVSEELKAHVLEMPYTLKDISMFVFLPPSVEGEGAIEYLVSNLTEERIEKAIDETWIENIDVSFPKMTIESSLDKELKQVLTSMGIKDLFDPTKANLTTFAPAEQLSVSKVIHETHLEVSEEGTEAASATLAFTRGRSARPRELLSFTCDHPFVFVIYDKFTKNVLFMGIFQHGVKE